MASSIHTGLILFALVHLGIAFSIWGPKGEQEATLNATLNILKSINKNPQASNIDEESKLLASKLLTLFKQVHGIQTHMMEIFNDELSKYVAEIISIIVNQSDDLKLQRASQEVHKNERLYINDYLNFLNDNIFPNEMETLIREALELDNEKSFEYSRAMSDFFKLYLSKFRGTLRNYNEIFPNEEEFLNELLKYNQRNEWNAFLMMTVAYKLQSLESNDNNYLSQFERLQTQLMKKLELHKTKYDEALSLLHAKDKKT